MNNLDSKSRDKIYFNLKKAQFTLDNELFKKLSDSIWEFRTLHNKKTYRLFSFWDKIGDSEILVVATHGILKKTQKTPLKEIHKAENLRIQYFNNKSKTS
jgi:phage-related protein